ncbi:MAG: GNAT family N-acetyltransferase [Alistipes sp.]|nr:GNAT family N-acetyltransferase [Alistipes sp.]
MEIRSLAGTGYNDIYNAFSEAFADYEMQLDRFQLQSMLQRRGFDPALSFAAFEGDRIVSFTLNGTGYYNGIPTAYDTGTGTLPSHRGQGLATRIFEHSIPHLKGAGIGRYLLEVLQHNTKAVSVYRNIGFTVSREFHYFRQDNVKVIIGARDPGIPLELKPIDIAEGEPPERFWDFPPSWQNSTESVKRSLGDFHCLGVFTGCKIIGYCIFEPSSGDVTQLAVDREYRRRGIALLLLRDMVRLNMAATVKVINTDTKCNAMTALLESVNIPLQGKQYEMVKDL